MVDDHPGYLHYLDGDRQEASDYEPELGAATAEHCANESGIDRLRTSHPTTCSRPKGQ